MNQEEALTKWCPFVIFSASQSDAINNRAETTSSGSHTSNCLTSKCMAWKEISNDKSKGGYCMRLDK